jgi:hypothetical protein
MSERDRLLHGLSYIFSVFLLLGIALVLYLEGQN